MSYPPHHYGSENRPANPSLSGPPYPCSPSSQSVNPPSLEDGLDAHMPTSAFGYPPQSSSCSPTSEGYPLASGGYLLSNIYSLRTKATFVATSYFKQLANTCKNWSEGSQNRPPYPSPSGPPYPLVPNSQSIYPPNLGYGLDAPLYMPMPMPSAPGYPPQSSGYPPTSGGYPPTTSAYPPAPGGYPSASDGYPSVLGGYPPSSTGYSPASSGYPPAPSACYPPQSGYQSSPPSIPSRSKSYPNSSQTSSNTHNSSHTSAYPRHPHTCYQNSSASYSNIYNPKPYPSYVTQSNSNQVMGGPIQKGSPTVLPANPFNPRDDAEVLRKAMKGFGTDEKAIISVLSKRSNAQRLQITVEFKTLYGKDLIKDLKSETSGKFEDLIVALMTPLPQFYARELHDAIAGIGTDEDVLIEVLCTKSNNEIRTIRQAYHSMYNKSLEDDLKGDTSGTFKRLMVSLCNACRDESMGTNQANAMEDAKSLLRAGELRLGTDESTFNMVLCQRNFAQLRLIFEEYYKITGHDFEQAIKNEFSGNSKEGMLAIVRSIRNLPGFFAKCLHKAIAGLGTDDKTLVRVVTTRCEIDMGNIKQNYLAQYGETLADAIKGDTSGDYKKLLLALIGES